MSEKQYADVRCSVCESVGAWKNVDQYRYKPQEMCICTSCGFVTYPKIIQNQKKLTEYYRDEYRDAPTFANICSGERKLHFHVAFLDSLFDDWKKRGLKSPKVFEIGSAFGMFVNWVRHVFPSGDIQGSELTESFVRNAHWLYGIRLQDKFDTSKKYDLIASYKVAEHMPDFDLELESYAKCLTDTGLLYISVPTWFDTMTNFGQGGFSVEYYYHPNHINAWTRSLFETLLRKKGFKIVKENHCYYDSTYLCAFDPAVSEQPAKYEDSLEIESRMAKILEAAKAFDQGAYEKAIEAYPHFPDAYAGFLETNRAKFHKNGFEWILENVGKRALAACPNSASTRILCADICMRYNQWEKALSFLKEAIEMKPQDPSIMLNIAHCFRQLSVMVQDKGEKIKLLAEAAKVCQAVSVSSQQAKQEAITWLMSDNAKIPLPPINAQSKGKPQSEARAAQ